jgi:hypothetical protein
MTETKENASETFEDFKRSFSYGYRSDLSFKFLAGLSDQDAADFFQGLLWKIGQVFDDGDFSRIIRHVTDGQIQAYAKPGRWTYDDDLFSPLPKPLSESRLVLITSTGHFVEGQDPEPFGVKDMTQQEAVSRINDFLKAEPILTAIPMDVPFEKLRVRHGGYDIRGVQVDPNVAFPIDHLRNFVAEGLIGEILPDAYSFVGAASQLQIINHAGPKWVDMLTAQDVEAALLVPV